jgi:hypothetical protein
VKSEAVPATAVPVLVTVAIPNPPDGSRSKLVAMLADARGTR